MWAGGNILFLLTSPCGVVTMYDRGLSAVAFTCPGVAELDVTHTSVSLGMGGKGMEQLRLL